MKIDFYSIELFMSNRWNYLNHYSSGRLNNNSRNKNFIQNADLLSMYDNFKEDLDDYRDKAKALKEILNLEMTQELAIAAHCQANCTQNLASKFNLSIENISKIEDDALKNSNSAIILLLSGDSLGHAICVCAFNSKVYWFDPNVGVCRSRIRGGLYDFINWKYAFGFLVNVFDTFEAYMLSLLNPNENIENINDYLIYK